MPEVVLAKHESEKHGQYWQCIGSEADSLTTGNRYFFTVPPEALDVTYESDIIEKTFPAVELPAFQACQEYGGSVIDALPNNFNRLGEDKQIAELLHFLGFGLEEDLQGIKLILPDPTTVCGRWARLKEEYPSLPELKILPASGIAGHLEFVKAYFDYDALVSMGAEFVHDVTAHVAHTIEFMWREKENYRDEKARYVARIEPGYQLLSTYLSDPTLQRGVPLSEKARNLLALSLGMEADFSSATRCPYGSVASHLLVGYQYACFPRVHDPENFFEVEERLLTVFLLAKNGIHTKEDGFAVFVNWDRLKLAAVETFGLPVIQPESAKRILQSAKVGEHIVSKKALYIRDQSGCKAFKLTVIASDDDKVNTYHITLHDCSVMTLKGQFDRAFSAEVIADILAGAVKAPVKQGALFAEPRTVAPKASNPSTCSL